MDVDLEHNGDVVAVVLRGDVDAAVTAELRQQLDDQLADGRQNFVVDLSDVAFMDSSGLATLVQLFKRVRIGHGDVRLCGLQPNVRRLFELIRLDRVFAMFPDRAAAYASFPVSDGR